MGPSPLNVFITGATGFVGRNFLEHVLREHPEADITCLVRDPEKARIQWQDSSLDLSRARWVQGDLLEPHTYAAALAEADLVFHIAAMVSLKNGPEFYVANRDATRCLLDGLGGGNRLRRLVYVSSISAIDRPMDRPAVGPLTEETPPHPNTDYGKSKLEAENLIITAGLPYSILRPPDIHGPYPRIHSSMDRLIHDVKNGKPYTRLPLPGRVSEIGAEDLAMMIWQAGQLDAARNQVFFIANPEPVVIGDAFAHVARELGIPYEPKPVTEKRMARYKSLLYRRQPDSLILRILFEDFFWCSPEKWYRLTGVQPRYGYAESVSRAVDWYREHGLL